MLRLIAHFERHSVHELLAKYPRVCTCVQWFTSSRLSARAHNLFSPCRCCAFCDKYRRDRVYIVSSLCSLRGERKNRMSDRRRAEPRCGEIRAAWTITEGRKKKAVHERQATGTAAGAFSAFADARKASGGILTSTLGPHYRPEHEYNNAAYRSLHYSAVDCLKILPIPPPSFLLVFCWVFTRNYATVIM